MHDLSSLGNETMVKVDHASEFLQAFYCFGLRKINYDLHFFMKRTWALAALWGDRSFHMRRVDTALFDTEIPVGPGETFT